MGISPAIKERGKKMNLKYLSEQRSENQEKMQKILDTANLKSEHSAKKKSQNLMNLKS